MKIASPKDMVFGSLTQLTAARRTAVRVRSRSPMNYEMTSKKLKL